jgi:DNA-binding SARP family transcriptional activator/tetratricopeptide (TPR) repeat protein
MTALGTDLSITCLGELRIERAGRDVTQELPGRQGRVLFAYLVVAGRPVSRDELIGALWPGRPPAHPDAALASVLAKVRRELPAGVIAGRKTLSLELPSDADVDVLQVRRSVADGERALSSGDSRTALEAAQAAADLVARPLLPAFGGEWVDAARHDCTAMRQRALETVARAGIALGAETTLAAAERAAQELVELQPFREDRYVLLMDAQARRGNSAEALRTFERLRVLLRDELGATPAPEVVAKHESVLHGEIPPASSADGNGASFPVPAVAPRTSEGAFVGREECLAQLRARWDECRAGRTGVVLLVGDPGVGKTRLATHFAEEVHLQGGAVLYGRADAEALLPYQPFAEALDHLLSHAGAEFSGDAERELGLVNRLFPSVRTHAGAVATPVDDETVRYQAFEAVVSLLARASAGWPLLLVLDDLHWADRPTLRLLRHVLRQAEGTRLLVLGTFRHVKGRDRHPLVDLLGDLRRERRYDRLTLDGFDEEATHALVADRFGGDVTRGFVRRLRKQTDGNAFFIEETVRALEDAGAPRDAVLGEDALNGLGVPEGVEEVILRRVRQLSALAADVLTAASVIGRSFRFRIVEQLVEGDTDSVMAAIDEGLAAGLVLEVADEVDVFTFSHALVREALYKQFTGTRRVRLHHRVAIALESLPEQEAVNPAELAYHYTLARHLAGPRPAREYSIKAGRRAAEQVAYNQAASHFRRALGLFEDGADERGRCEVLLALGRVEWQAGDDGARDTLMAAAKSAQERGAADQLARAALGLGERFFEVTYLGARYRDLLEQAIAAVGPHESADRALLLGRLAENLAFPNEDDGAQELAESAVAMARRLGDERVLARVLHARHLTLLDVRHIVQRSALSHELSLLVGGHQALTAELHHWRMYDLLGLGDLDAARREYVELEALAGRLGQPLFRSLALGARGLWAELAGDVEAAERCADESLHQARLAHTGDAVSSWASQLFALRRRCGRLEELAPYVERLAGSGGHQLGWRSALGVLCFETGDIDGARRIYEQELGDGPDGLPRGMFWLTRMSLLSELGAMVGDAAGARKLYAALAPHARWNVVVAYCSFWGPVDSYLALLAETMGDLERAARHVRSAFERVRAMAAPALMGDLERRHAGVLPELAPQDRVPAHQESLNTGELR